MGGLEVDHGGAERDDGEVGVEHVDEEADEGSAEGSLAGQLNRAGRVEIGLESFIDGECWVGHGVGGVSVGREEHRQETVASLVFNPGVGVGWSAASREVGGEVRASGGDPTA